MAINTNKAAQQVKNNRLIIAVWENKGLKQKRDNVEKILLSGADVNAPSANLKNNTALHIAVKKAEIDIIKLLLKNDADITRTNSFDETALDIAKTLKGDVGQEIVTLLEERLRIIEEATIDEPIESDAEDNQLHKDVDTAQRPKYFLMQDRNTGVRGHLYETKLLCLVPLRAENDEEIEDYYLASNIAGVGVFDDVGFKYTVKGRSIRIFLQAKHRDLPKKGRLALEDVLKPDGELSLAVCFDSFLQIKKKFDPKSSDPMFRESYETVEFNFIIYTSGEESFNRKLIGRNERSPKVHKLIYTGGRKSIFQFDYKDEDIYCITRDVQRMRIKLLAQNFIEFILGEKDKYKHMLEDDLIKKYHCVLEQIAVRLCKVGNNYIEAEFRSQLQHTTDPFTVLLKEELCKSIIEKCCVKSTKVKEGIVKEFTRLPKEPSSIALVPFIGTVITYDKKNNKLKVLDNIAKKGLKSNDIKILNEHLKQIHVNSTVIAEAIMKAGEQKLLSTKFKLPSSFGNIDMMIKDSRIAYVVSILKELFEINKEKGEIVINESNLGKNLMQNSKNTLTEGFVGHNGGIGSAVGNLLIHDDNKKTLKFNTARPQFEKAYKLLIELEQVVPEGKKLTDYVIKVNTLNFPRASFSNDEYDNTLAKFFLNRLWFYCNQGKEDEVEKSVKIEIDKYYNENKDRLPFRFRTHIDSIFSKFHSEVQKWWMVSSENSLASHLTSSSEIFRIAQEGIDSSLLTLHNEMYLSRIKKTGIEFTTDAVRRLGLDERAEKIINIQTVNEMLSTIKIHQHYKKQNNYNFMDLCYMLSLPPEDRNVIFDELRATIVDILVVVCGLSRTDTSVNDDLNYIVNTFKGSKVVVVTPNVQDSNTKITIPGNVTTIVDNFNNFTCLDEDSQKKFLDETVVIFQDEKLRLADMVDETMMKNISAKMLTNLMANERLEIGRTLTNKQYEDIKDYYVPRRLIKYDSEDLYPVNSIDDIEDKVLVIVTKHGMGKSTLMTHVALETKKIDPTRWIVRINLADFEDDFYGWQKNKIKINKAIALKILCMESLKHVDRKTIFQLVEQGEAVVLDIHSSSGMDGTALLELELFLHYYNEHKVSFLFYGFDYVCPPFGAEAIKLLKILEASDNTMWIACHAVGPPMSVLQKSFGTLYKLQHIDETAQTGFFYKFWKSNLQIEKINSEVVSYIAEFLENISGKSDLHSKPDRMLAPWLTMPLHVLYLLVIDFFQTEISNFSFKDVQKTFKKHLDIDLTRGSKLSSFLDETPEAQQAAELAGTPLHMYVAANYFHCKIKGQIKIEPDVPEIRKKWDLWRDTLQLYERFLKHNMDKVCMRSDAINLDEDKEVEKRQNFFARHKKLALLAICKEEDLCKLLPDDEIQELKNTISRINSGEEKSALVDCVLNNTPRFFNIMYAEHCAVEIMIDFFKNVQNDTIDQIRFSRVWDFIVNVLLYSCSNSVRSAFDYKLKHDSQLAEITSSDHCKNIIFELLLKQNGEGVMVDSDGRSTLQAAVDSGMNNFVKVLLMSIETNLNKDNVKSFVKVLKRVDLFCLLLNIFEVKAPTNFTEFLTDLKLDRVVDLLNSEELVELPMSALSLFANTDVVENMRRNLHNARQRLVEKAADRFGLSEDNIKLFRQIAETVKRHKD